MGDKNNVKIQNCLLQRAFFDKMYIFRSSLKNYEFSILQE